MQSYTKSNFTDGSILTASQLNNMDNQISTITNTINNEEVPSKFNITLLWTNGSTSSAFPAQTISLDLSNYKQILVRFFHYDTNAYPSTGSYIVSNTFINKGETVWIFTSAWNNATRVVTVSNSGVSFGEGYYFGTWGNPSSLTSNSWHPMPYQIYGIK